MPHRNAPLSELGRLRLARVIVEQGWPVARAAERFQVSRTTAGRWAARYRDHGPSGMADRSSRPHHSPRRTPAPVVRKVMAKRRDDRYLTGAEAAAALPGFWSGLEPQVRAPRGRGDEVRPHMCLRRCAGSSRCSPGASMARAPRTWPGCRMTCLTSSA